MTRITGTKRSWAQRVARLCLLSALLAVASIIPTIPAEATNSVLVNEGESIQAAIDNAAPGTKIRVSGAHIENVWINKDGITLTGLPGASITLPAEPTATPCGFALIVCAIPAAAIEAAPQFPPLDTYLRDIKVQNLTLHAPNGTGIGVIFVHGADIRDNTMPTGAGGFSYTFASSNVRVRGNEVAGPLSADAIRVDNSQQVNIVDNSVANALFSGISTTDSSNVEIRKNTVSGSCIGIAATNAGLGAAAVSITHNETTANNSVCFPFGPEIPLGATGILVAGVDGVVVKHNVANDNVTDQFTVTAGGISVLDAVSGDVSKDVVVSHNTAFGNTSVTGPTDLTIATAGTITTVKKNSCEFSSYSPTWCES